MLFCGDAPLITYLFLLCTCGDTASPRHAEKESYVHEMLLRVDLLFDSV